MAKTELGSQVLTEKGHFVEFAEFIRQHGWEQEDPEIILKLKSILWAVVRRRTLCWRTLITISRATLAQLHAGFHSLKRRRLSPRSWILHNNLRCCRSEGEQTSALQHLPYTLLRTCFFVLGLISSTPQGAEILDDCGWEATISPLGATTGLCVPRDLDAFLSVRIVALGEIILRNVF